MQQTYTLYPITCSIYNMQKTDTLSHIGEQVAEHAVRLCGRREQQPVPGLPLARSV